MRIVYQVLLALTFLFYLPKAFLRKRLPHAGWSMRLGRYPDAVRERLAGRQTIWVHAVSVGEAIAARPLIQELLRVAGDHPLVVSTVTHTGFDVASTWLGPRGLTIYAPLDFTPCVRRAVAMIRPKVLIVMESELWPILFRHLAAQDVPILIVNGRVSARAFRRYLWVKPILRGMLRSVRLYLMQSKTDAERVIAMGAPPDRVRVMGSLKWDASHVGQPDPSGVSALRQTLRLEASQPVIVAGSTHRGEEEALLDAFARLCGHLDTARLILAPRHIERIDEVDALVRRQGLSVARASTMAAEPSAWDVLLVDVMGQLPNYYALASVVFVGGSLIPHGGQNPIEPAGLGKPILFGPHMHNFSDIVQQLLAGRGARQLTGPDELMAALLEMLTNRAGTEAMGRRALQVTREARGVAQRTLAALAPFLKVQKSEVRSQKSDWGH